MSPTRPITIEDVLKHKLSKFSGNTTRNIRIIDENISTDLDPSVNYQY